MEADAAETAVWLCDFAAGAGTLWAMRRWSRLLCVLLSASFLLAPLNTLHAHISPDHEHSSVHGGHIHHNDLNDHVDEDESGQTTDKVVDLQIAMADRGASSFSWTSWLPLIASFAIVGFLSPYLTAVLRPPPQSLCPTACRAHHWQPPLRGPPVLPINGR